jgi:hypothetical protein
MPLFLSKSPGSVVGTVTGFELADRESELKSWQCQEFSFLQIVQTVSAAHSAYQRLFPGCRAYQGREAVHSHPSSPEVKDTWIYGSILSYIFMAQHSVQ